LLHWSPRLNLQQSLDMTLSWHQAWRGNKDMAAFSLEQISEYEQRSGSEL